MQPENKSYTPYDSLGAECSICLQEMIPFHSVLTIGACGHMFHKTCLDRGQDSTTTCVKCRGVFNPGPFAAMYPPDHNEIESCMTVCNVLALNHVEPSTVKSLKFVHAGPIPDTVTNFPNLLQVLVYEAKTSDDDFEDVDDSTPLTPCSVDAIYNCPTVSYLRCTNVYMLTISNSISNLRQLTYLCLDNCSIETLPDMIGELVQLEYLDVSTNFLTELPDCVGSLTKLKHLHVKGNKLSTLPDSLSNLTDLQMLDMSHNSFETLPECIRHFANLRSLACHATGLREVPNWLSDLQGLDEVCFSCNPRLKSLPLSKTVVKWTDLDISRTAIHDFEFLECTPDLTSLDISDMRLKQLPSELADLSQLQTLLCSFNKISDIPANRLPISLITLDLGSNKFRGNLPYQLQQLPNLVELDLKHNMISTIRANTTFKELAILNLSHNVLGCVETTDVYNFPNLVELDVSSNIRLVDITHAILTFPHMSTIDVANCPNLRLPLLFMDQERVEVMY
jgi:Leucine-rich repeat (LRR) protein